MGFEMFVQGFENGDAADLDSSVFHAVWGPYVDRNEPEFGFWRIRADDGGEADIYAGTLDKAFTGFMITHFSSGRVLDLLVEFIVAADAVVMPVGCPTLLAHADQQRHLPEEIRAGAVVVREGTDVERVLAEN
ncbi:hypothetical protein GCM10010435_22220 [Winogradskya consettensis]|uniref:Uncharacterized protein n=1 Tax=Winogradskya consettensis TaxID=113560 RepID=A0A919T4Z6_9ACTN|nr:hypothetical protein [Actinoplanes consettensis]GIM85177.1 hypothetical protein Aco04nite_94930 [Actinoplanes consettensis]